MSRDVTPHHSTSLTWRCPKEACGSQTRRESWRDCRGPWRRRLGRQTRSRRRGSCSRLQRGRGHTPAHGGREGERAGPARPGLSLFSRRLDARGAPAFWRTTRDFSSRYSEICAPTTAPRASKSSSVYFPKRELLSFMTVTALPKASSSGFTCSTRLSRSWPWVEAVPGREERDKGRGAQPRSGT